jgi:Xaa-Pro aminopeptidase
MEDHQDRHGRQNPRSDLSVAGLERGRRIQNALLEYRLDLLVCALPANVLMMSGYWPVVGAGAALAFRGGPIVLLIPADEYDLAARGWADAVHTFKPASLQSVGTVADAIEKPLAALAGGPGWRIGYEAGASSEPASYAAMHLYGGRMASLIGTCFPQSELFPADEILADLRARKTGAEIERIRTTCEIAAEAFVLAAGSISSGIAEIDVANRARNCLSSGMAHHRDVQRADGFAWCMSGPNSALAGAAYARSRLRQISCGDLVLLHCNSYADGYWTDVTRTWCAGRPDARARDVFAAVFAAREAALAAIRPKVSGASVDRAARQKMQEHGFAAAFKHSTGHGVGFEAISAEARPRLHPASPDVLEPGMVFNVEPAAYFEGYGGVRHCDMIAVTEKGYDLLTPFQCNQEDAVESSVLDAPTQE